MPQPAPKNQSRLLHNISRIGPESRQIIPARLRKKFGATGMLWCENRKITAQLMGKANVITTAGHFFFDEECNPRRIEDCVFGVGIGEKFKKYLVKPESLRMGSCSGIEWRTDLRPGIEPLIDFRKDWAVLQLTGMVEGVTAYEIPD